MEIIPAPPGVVMLPLGVFFWAFSLYVGRLGRSRLLRDLIVVGLGLGSVMYPYGVIFVGHALGAALAFLAFMALSPPSGGAATLRARAAGGVALGAAVLFEYQLVIVAAAGRLRLLALPAGVLVVLAGPLPFALFLAAYHTVVFGKWALPWGTSPTGFAAYHAKGFPSSRPRGGRSAHMLFAPDLGLFMFSPFLIFGVAGAVHAARGRRAEGVTILGRAAMLLFISSMTFGAAGGARACATSQSPRAVLACGIARTSGGWAGATPPGPHGGIQQPGHRRRSSCRASPRWYSLPPQFPNPVFDCAAARRRGWSHGLGYVLACAAPGALRRQPDLAHASVALGAGGASPPRPALRRCRRGPRWSPACCSCHWRRWRARPRQRRRRPSLRKAIGGPQSPRGVAYGRPGAAQAPEAIELGLEQALGEREQRDVGGARHQRRLLDRVRDRRGAGDHPTATLRTAAEARERPAGLEGVHAGQTEIDERQLGAIPLRQQQPGRQRGGHQPAGVRMPAQHVGQLHAPLSGRSHEQDQPAA